MICRQPRARGALGWRGAQGASPVSGGGRGQRGQWIRRELQTRVPPGVAPGQRPVANSHRGIRIEAECSVSQQVNVAGPPTRAATVWRCGPTPHSCLHVGAAPSPAFHRDLMAQAPPGGLTETPPPARSLRDTVGTRSNRSPATRTSAASNPPLWECHRVSPHGGPLSPLQSRC